MMSSMNLFGLFSLTCMKAQIMEVLFVALLSYPAFSMSAVCHTANGCDTGGDETMLLQVKTDVVDRHGALLAGVGPGCMHLCEDMTDEQACGVGPESMPPGNCDSCQRCIDLNAPPVRPEVEPPIEPEIQPQVKPQAAMQNQIDRIQELEDDAAEEGEPGAEADLKCIEMCKEESISALICTPGMGGNCLGCKACGGTLDPVAWAPQHDDDSWIDTLGSTK